MLKAPVMMSSFVVLFLTSQYMPIQCVYLEDLSTFISTSELVQYFHCTSNLKLRSWFRLPGLSDAEVGLDMEIASGISWTPTFPNDDVLHLCSCLLTATVVEALSSQNVLKLGMVTYHTYVAQKMATTNQAISPHSYETVGDYHWKSAGQHWGANFSRSLEAWNLEQNNEDYRDNWNRKHNFDTDKESTDSTNGY